MSIKDLHFSTPLAIVRHIKPGYTPFFIRNKREYKHTKKNYEKKPTNPKRFSFSNVRLFFLPDHIVSATIGNYQFQGNPCEDYI